MGQLAVAGGGAAVGAVVGSFVGMPMLGAQVGWALGGIAGAALFPTEVTSEGSRLGDLTVQTSGYGVAIPVLAGTVKIAGNVIWIADMEERKTTRRSGKGTVQKTTSYSYYLSWAIGLGEWLIPPTAPEVLRIWLDTILVYDATGQSEVTQVPGLVWRFYPGSETQLPDPLIEATVGAENAPAHRGLAYIVFEDVPLEQFGNRLPNVTVEMVGQAERVFTQVPTQGPASPIWPSAPGSLIASTGSGPRVAVDHARGRIYEGRRRTSGTVGNANDCMIRVYDLATMETVGEYPMGDIVKPVFPPGVTPSTDSVGPGILHIAADGNLYVTGGNQNRQPLFKIDPDSMRAIDVFGNPQGDGWGFGDNGTRLYWPQQIRSFQAPKLGGGVATFLVVQGPTSTSLIIDAETMTYVWGAGDIAVTPPPVPINLGLAPASMPVQIVPGRTRDDGARELFCLRAWSSPGRVEVARYRVLSHASNLGLGVAAGISRDDDMTIDLIGAVDAAATAPTLQGAWFDETDGTLVITVAGQGDHLAGYSRCSTFKWAPGGSVIWKVVDHALPALQLGRGDMGRVFGGTWGLAGNLYLQTGTGDTLVNAAGADFENLYWLDERQAVLGFVTTPITSSGIAKRYLDRLTPATLQLGEVVEALCVRAGLAPEDLDVSALTQDLRGYILSSQTSARQALTPLAAFGQFDAVEQDDVLVFRLRGGSVVATIPYDDAIRESDDAIVLEEQRAQDADLPADLTVRYLDVDRAWEQSSQRWARPRSPVAVMGGNASATMDLPMPLTSGEAKSIARKMLTATWQERTKLTVSLGWEHLRVVPTDPIIVTTRDGAQIRCRVLSAQLGANWVTRLELVTEDAASYSLTAEADSGAGFVQAVIPLPYHVRLMLPDLPLIADGDDTGQAALREYALVGAYSAGVFRGVVVYRSPDGSDWTELGAVVTSAAWGSLLETPGAPASPWTWDDVNTLEVRLESGDVETADASEVLNWGNLAALIAPDGTAELVQWRVATETTANRYSLSGLLRGRRGTEDLIGSRGAGDAFVVLSGALRFQALTSEATEPRSHRAVTIYDSVETAAPTVTKSLRGRAERPYAPCHVAGVRDGSNNLTVTWKRRTRFGGEWLSGTGTVPVNEATEAYEVEVLNGSTVVRTITGLSTPSATYSAAQQSADFGAAQPSVAVRIYQMSGIVGRGVAAEAVV